MMTQISQALLHPHAGTAGVIALLGYGVVFLGLAMLLAVVAAMGRVMAGRHKTAPAAPAAPAAAPVEKPAAKGTAGELKLYNVEPRDAALIMAIVAHKLGKPVNELRFRSIKEVEEK